MTDRIPTPEPPDSAPKKTKRGRKRDVDAQMPPAQMPAPADIMQLLNAHLQTALNVEKEESKEERTINQEIAALEPIIAEFLKSFIVIGYTLEGQKVFIGHAKSQEQHDALVEHFRATFFNIIGGSPQ